MNNGGIFTLAMALRAFLGDYLPHQKAYSVNTILSYRDSLKLLLQFAAGKRGRVSELSLANLNVPTITAFLDSLEAERGNGATTRNVRLSAIHSFFEYLSREYPEHLEQAQRVLNVPFKRTATAVSITSKPTNSAPFWKASTDPALPDEGTTCS